MRTEIDSDTDELLRRLRLVIPGAPRNVAHTLVMVKRNLGDYVANAATSAWLARSSYILERCRKPTKEWNS